MIPPLKQWIIENKYYIKRGTDTKLNKPTHYLLDGGIWKVPLHNYKTFLRLLSSDLSAGEKYYISENKTDIFRFICDLDFYDSTEISIESIQKIVNILNDVIIIHFGVEYSKVIICGTETKNKNDLIKTGFHLIWPEIWINVNNAKIIRNIFINKLIEILGERDKDNKWEEVVDKAIYDQNGLRMVGCRKIVKCNKCNSGNNNNSENVCNYCNGTKKYDEGRIYKPILTIYKEFSEEESIEYINNLKNSYYSLLLDTHIIMIYLKLN